MLILKNCGARLFFPINTFLFCKFSLQQKEKKLKTSGICTSYAITLKLVRPVTELALVEEPVDDLVNEGVYECAAADGKDPTHPVCIVREPCKDRSTGHGSKV